MQTEDVNTVTNLLSKTWISKNSINFNGETKIRKSRQNIFIVKKINRKSLREESRALTAPPEDAFG